MKRLNVAGFLREVLAELDDLPEGLEQKLIDTATTSPTTRSGKIREVIEEATNG